MNFYMFIENVWVIICLYVDDMWIFGTDINVIDSTIKNLSPKFEMEDWVKIM